MGDGKMGVVDPGYGSLGPSEADKAAAAAQAARAKADAELADNRRAHAAAMPSKANQALTRGVLSWIIEAAASHRSTGLDTAEQADLIERALATLPATFPAGVRAGLKADATPILADALRTGDFGTARERVRAASFKLAQDLPKFYDADAPAEPVSDEELVKDALTKIPRAV